MNSGNEMPRTWFTMAVRVYAPAGRRAAAVAVWDPITLDELPVKYQLAWMLRSYEAVIFDEVME